jgi:hypothetical protein
MFFIGAAHILQVVYRLNNINIVIFKITTGKGVKKEKNIKSYNSIV